MNKQLYRIIFSKTQQRLVVVSEIATREGKAKGEGQQNSMVSDRTVFDRTLPFAGSFAWTLKTLNMALYTAFGFLFVTSSAVADELQIRADQSAPKNQQAIVLQTANGLPQVNIQTPNDKGLSHNKYQQFDVAEKGAILNNSRSNVQTEQGGWVQGNPYLARGEAKVILNEVNASNPSQLKGYVEVAGQRADVIIANPAGINCQGCGTINAGRTTLTTGQVELENGMVKGYQVEQGKVTVSGRGMDTSRSDYTDIIAKETEINAGIWAKELKVTTGQNKVSRDNRTVEVIHTGGNSNHATESEQVRYAVDVSELGGMYAGKIHLVGTEDGLGVRNAGHIGASQGNIQIDSQGQIVNSGFIGAQTDVTVTAKQQMKNTGTVYTQQGNINLTSQTQGIEQHGSVIAKGNAQGKGKITVQAQEKIIQQGETLAEGDIDYQAKRIQAEKSATLAAGITFTQTEQGEQKTLNPQNDSGKNLTLTATESAVAQGQNLASNRLDIQADTVDIAHSNTSANQLNITARRGDINANDSRIRTEKDITLSTSTALLTQRAELNGCRLDIKANSINNLQGTWIQRDNTDFSLNLNGGLDNREGYISTKGHFLISDHQLNNRQGTLIAGQQLKINTHLGSLLSEKGRLIAADNLMITSGYLDNRQGLIQSQKQISIDTQHNMLVNDETLDSAQDKGIVASDRILLNAGELSNRSGRIVSHGDQIFNAIRLSSQKGLMSTQGNFSLQTTSLDNSQGKIFAEGKMDMVLTGNLQQQSGQINGRQVNLAIARLDSTANSLISGERIDLMVNGTLSNQESTINAEQTVNISSRDLNNRNGMIIARQNTVQIDTHYSAIDNTAGKIGAGTALSIYGGRLDNTSGLLQSGADMSINTHQHKLINTNTRSDSMKIPSEGILALGDLVIQTQQFVNDNGYLATLGQQKVTAQSIHNHQGIISSQDTQNLIVNDIIQNHGGRLSAKGSTISASRIENINQGAILSGEQLQMTATDSLDNTSGTIQANEDIGIVTGGLNNQQGAISSAWSNLIMNATGLLNNTQGRLYAQNGMTLSGYGLNNEKGEIYTNQGDLTLNTNKRQLVNTHGGSITSGRHLTLNTGEIINRQGTVFSHGDAVIVTDDRLLTNTQQGKITSLGSLDLSTSMLDNQGGFIQSAKAMRMTLSQTLWNQKVAEQGSFIQSGQTLTLNAPVIDNSNTLTTEKTKPERGILAENLQVTADRLDNNRGGIYSRNNANFLIKNQLQNHKGEILALGDLDINGDQLLIQNPFGKIQTNQQLNIESRFLSGDGDLSAKHIALTLKEDFTAKTAINAGETLSVFTHGKLINDTNLYADHQVILDANTIENTRTGRISSADTRLTAVSNVTNRGLINSVTDDGRISNTVIKARQIDNMGWGRIYGDHVALQADTILNTDEDVGGEVRSATIAARNRLDLAGSEIINNTAFYEKDKKSGSTIYSDGDIIFGRILNEQNQASGNADVLRNRSSIIEANGKIALHVNDVQNTNEHYSTIELEYPEEGNKQSVEYIILNPVKGDLNTGHRININRFVRLGLGNGVYDHGWDRDLSRKLEAEELEAGYIPEANRMKCASGDPSLCYYSVASFYDPDYVIWDHFGLEAPKSFPVVENLPNPPQEPTRPIFMVNEARRLRYERDFARYRQEVEAYNAALAPYIAWVEANADVFRTLNAKIREHNQPYTEKLSERWSIKTTEKKVYKTTVDNSLPGQILAGSDILLYENNLTNDKSVVISGGQIEAISNHVNNIGAQGFRKEEYLGIKHWYDAWNDGNLLGSKWKWHDAQEGPVSRIEETSFPINIFSYFQHTPPQKVTENIPGEKPVATRQILGDIQTVTLSGEKHADIPSITLAENIGITDLANNATIIKTPLFSMVDGEVRSMQVDTRLPTQSLYRINPAADSHYLVETDPDFTHRKKWLSSDYMFNALRYDPTNMHKRLGDGYYEQRLVREQISRLTGALFLDGHTDFESQYKALMEAGVTFAQTFNLQPGIALSREQVAQLTSDLVWFETQSVTLADGQVESVLVPKVYALTRKGDVDGTGSLLSGNKLVFKTNEIINSGTIAGRELVQFDTGSLKNSGRIASAIFTANVRGDAENIGGVIEADKALLLNVGGNFTSGSTTRTTSVVLDGYRRTDTTLDRKGLLYVKGEDGTLRVAAKNIDLNGADMINEGRGLTLLSAQQDLRLGTVSVGFEENMGEGDHYRNTALHDVVISRVAGKGDVQLQAGNIYSTGASLEAEKRLIALADNDLVLGSVTRASEYEEYHHNETRSTFAKSSETSYDLLNQRQQQGSQLSGEHILLQAGHDISAAGVTIVADQDMAILAGNNVDIRAAENRYNEQRIREKKQSGLMSSGGIGFTIGSKSESHQYDEKGTTQSDARAAIGSLGSNVSITAGNHVNILGTDLIAQADKLIEVQGKTLKVEAGKDIIESSERHEFKQSGLTVALSTPVTDAALAARSSLQRSGQVKDGRLSALYQVKAATEVAMAAQATADTANTISNIADGAMQQGAVSNPQVKLSVSLGSQKSTSTSHSTQVTHSGSELSAGNIKLTTTEGDIDILGSHLNAQKITLDSADKINLESVQDTYTNRADNKNSGGSIGAFIGANGNSYGVGFEASVQKGKGWENSDSVTQRNTVLNSDHLTLNSGGDTNIKGVVVNAKRLDGNIAGDLNLESRQDTNRYDSKQVQASASGSFTWGTGGGGSVNVSQNKAKVNYAQVEEQTGLFVGEDGMNLTVGGNTDLKGAVIASQAEASKNHFSTKTLTHEKIENHSEVSVQNISAGISSSGSSPMQAIGLAANLLGNVNKNDSSTTQSAVSGNINLTVRDGETPTALSRDTENANQSVKVFDKEEYKERAEMAQVIGQISKNAVSIATYEDRRDSAKLKDQAKDAENANDEAKAKALYAQAADIDKRIDDKFGIGSTNGQAIAAVTAVLQGLAGDNIGQAVAGGLSPYVNAKIKELTKDNDEANIAAHALWGAIEAQASGNNALAGAAGAAGGEITARLLTEQLYGKKPEELTASEKETISSLSQVVGALSSVAVADNGSDGYRGAEVAKSAVENNYLFKQEAQEKAVLQQKLRDGTATEKEKEQLDEINRLDIARDEAIIKACTGSVSSEACQSLISQAQYAQFGYEQAVSYNLKVKELYPNDYQVVEAILKGKGAEEAEFEKIAINLSNSGNMSLDEAKSYLRTVKTYQAFAELVGQVYAPAALDKITTGSLPKGISANEKLPAVSKTTGYEKQTTNITTGAENIALYPKLKEQLIQENLQNIGKLDSKLEQVVESLGKQLDYGISGRSTYQEANRLGKIWVGDDFTEMKLNGNQGESIIGWLSSDGLRAYRFPSEKGSKYAETGIQANFETYKVNPVTNKKEKIGNAHLNIEGK